MLWGAFRNSWVHSLIKVSPFVIILNAVWSQYHVIVGCSISRGHGLFLFHSAFATVSKWFWQGPPLVLKPVGCWCPGSLCCQVISNHAIWLQDEWVSYLPWMRRDFNSLFSVLIYDKWSKVVFMFPDINSTQTLTHFGLAMPYSNRNLGQHWLR